MKLSKNQKHYKAEEYCRTIVADPYRWLEDGNSSKTKEWAKKENKRARVALAKLPHQKFFRHRLGELWRVNSIGVPHPKNGRYFIWERKKNQELSVLYVQNGLKGKRKVLIDENKLSKTKTATVIGWSVSEDAEFLAYTISEKSNDQKSIHVLNVVVGKKLSDVIPDHFYPAMHSGIVWNRDSTGFWYSRRWSRAAKGEEKLHQKLYYHKLGDNWKNDQLVFGKDIPKEATPDAVISVDNQYLIVRVSISSGRRRRNDVYIKNLESDGEFLPVVKNLDGIFSIFTHRDKLYIYTNYKTPNWKLMAVSLKNAHLGIKHWRVVIPEGKFVLDYAKTCRDRLFTLTIENVHYVLKMYDLRGRFISEIKLPTLGVTSGLFSEREGDEIFFSFTSFLVPSQIYRFNLNKNKLELLKQLKLKINFKRFIAKQVWFRSKDGTRVPMFLVHKKDIVLNGKNPTILYGYGGFNSSSLPGFRSNIIPFLELGGVYAIPNIRGGGEFGEKWHEAGTKNKKQNTFDDFIAAAEWLIKNKYTDPNHLAASGWSNGGLLMGVMITQRPDLFKAIMAGAPVMDMLRFHKFHGGRHWISDYGNPDNPKDFKYLLRYSPYHNLKGGVKYPATLVLTAEGDDRVHPMHAYKFVARFLETNTFANPILLRIESKAGHGGSVSISNSINEYSDIFSFICWQLGVK